MTTTAHSEFGKLEQVIVKPVAHAFLSDEKLSQEWQSLSYLEKPVLQKAKAEFDFFEDTLKQADTEVLHLPETHGLTIDSIYCRDAAIATDFGMIICRMGKAGRVKEPAAERHFFEASGIAVLGEISSPGTLEGGDVAWLDQHTLAVGHSYRTNESGIAQLKAMLEPEGIEVIVAQLPHYKGPSDVFHLMSILSPVDKDLAVVYSPLMPAAFRNELLQRSFRLVEVPDEEFDSMGCNVLALAPRHCLMVDGNQITQSRLVEAGCRVISYAGTEISVKGGGGPTCLTRPLLRAV